MQESEGGAMKPIATLIIHGLPEMKKSELKRLLIWLSTQAEAVVSNPKEYNRRYTAQLHHSKAQVSR